MDLVGNKKNELDLLSSMHKCAVLRLSADQSKEFFKLW